MRSLTYSRPVTLIGLAAIVVTLSACGSNYELESGTTEIFVEPGTWQFEKSDSKGSGGGNGAETGGSAGDAAGATDDVALPATDAAAPTTDALAATDLGDRAEPDVGACTPCDAACQDDACTLRSCVEGCCQAVAMADSVACDDGDTCTGEGSCEAGACKAPPLACDDGLGCTVDACTAEAGCTHALQDGHCLIEGQCVADGEGSAGAVCAVCNSALATDAWSLATGCCQQDADCPTAGVCDQPVCDVGSGTCSTTKKLGCCESDTACDDGDLCTLDACELATGTCKSTPKVCEDASACEPGVCDASTGACAVGVKPGFCAIAGTCVPDGTSNPAEPCLRCHSLASQTTWSPHIGAPCDDNEVCTQDDTCTEKGSCLGQPKANCCKSDVDCAPLTDACTTALCLQSAHVCVVNAKAGCCKEGACCDLASNTLKASGTMCAANIVAFEYQCVGQAAQRRDLYPGCTGQSASVCSSDASFLFAGNWTTVQTCSSDTTCTIAGSGQAPTCQPKGTCAGACGGTASTGACSCAPGCEQAGTCCGDYKAKCACSSGTCCDSGLFAAKGKPCGSSQTQYQCSGQTLQKRDGAAACNGSSATCPAVTWGTWKTAQTCPSGTTCTVNATKTSGSCESTAGSCAGKCGGQGSGACWCDGVCKEYGDCCKDFAGACAGSVCGAPAASCNGKCGGQGAGGCWCDSACKTLGDCCADMGPCCP